MDRNSGVDNFSHALVLSCDPFPVSVIASFTSVRGHTMSSQGLDRATLDAALAYGVVDACRVSGLGRTLIYRLIAEGKIEARRCGGRTLIPSDSLRAFLAALPPAPIREKTAA